MTALTTYTFRAFNQVEIFQAPNHGEALSIANKIFDDKKLFENSAGLSAMFGAWCEDLNAENAYYWNDNVSWD